MGIRMWRWVGRTTGWDEVRDAEGQAHAGVSQSDIICTIRLVHVGLVARFGDDGVGGFAMGTSQGSGDSSCSSSPEGQQLNDDQGQPDQARPWGGV